MYRVGICDDDKILCSLLEEQIQELSAEFLVKFEIEVWYCGESLERDLKKGVTLDILFLDIELLQKDGIEIGAFIRDEMGDTDTHIVYISSKQGYAMELFKMQPLEFLVKPISAVRLKDKKGWTGGILREAEKCHGAASGRFSDDTSVLCNTSGICERVFLRKHQNDERRCPECQQTVQERSQGKNQTIFEGKNVQCIIK